VVIFEQPALFELAIVAFGQGRALNGSAYGSVRLGAISH
jgi:hypothetical protein